MRLTRKTFINTWDGSLVKTRAGLFAKPLLQRVPLQSLPPTLTAGKTAAKGMVRVPLGSGPQVYRQPCTARSSQGSSLGRFAHITILILFAFLLAKNELTAQVNVSKDIQNINLAMFDAETVEMELEYLMYFDDRLQSEMKGIVKKRGNDLYQKIGAITIIKKEPYCLFIDDERKIMVLDPFYPDDEVRKTRDDILNINVDSLKSYVLGTEAFEKGALREYVFTLKKGMYSRIKMEFNTENYFINKLELVQREDYKSPSGSIHAVKMVVNFKRTETGTELTDKTFNMDAFVSIDANQKKAQAVGHYKQYRFNSNIDKTITIQ